MIGTKKNPDLISHSQDQDSVRVRVCVHACVYVCVCVCACVRACVPASVCVFFAQNKRKHVNMIRFRSLCSFVTKVDQCCRSI